MATAWAELVQYGLEERERESMCGGNDVEVGAGGESRKKGGGVSQADVSSVILNLCLQTSRTRLQDIPHLAFPPATCPRSVTVS